ncbi:MAG: HNH endonuclease [Microscillaceae bacterium]|nr:HNH endonuclease [Microscillaceae bacterium]
MKGFLDYYDLVSQTSDQSQFKNNVHKVCRYCGKSSLETSFKTIPHIIPELFGKNSHTRNNECDACNQKFQLYESHTATFIQPFLTLYGVSTKKGIPEFQSRKNLGEKSTKLKVIDGKREFKVMNNLDDFKYFGKNGIRLTLRTRHFIPFYIYKLFFKIGISLLPDSEVEDNKHYLELLSLSEPISDGLQFYSIWRYTMSSKIFLNPQAQLYKAKSIVINQNEFPEYVLMVQTGNLIYQFFLPISLKNIEFHNTSNFLILELFPSFIHEADKFIKLKSLKKIDIKHLDLSITKKICFDEVIEGYYRKKETFT